MSSTNRGSARVHDDVYLTPPWAVWAILPHVLELSHGLVLDPCCANGQLLQQVQAYAGLHGRHVRVRGIELSPPRTLDLWCVPDIMQADALECGLASWDSDLIVTNPPYSRAMEFVARALEARRDRSVDTIAMLLRLAWAAGQKRAEFHRAFPSDVYVLPRRPSFTGQGTDSCDYAWFVWGPGRGGRWSVLDLTEALEWQARLDAGRNGEAA